LSTILLIDDSEDTRDAYALFLEREGWQVHTAADGAEGLVKAGVLQPGLVVVDLEMPGIDGWELTRRLKADDGTRSIPVVALSGHGLPEHQDKAFGVGVAAYLVKPCAPEALALTIRRCLAS
jgi:CheY-like chemotaxis protein